jgi:hypothetical protein
MATWPCHATTRYSLVMTGASLPSYPVLAENDRLW